MNHLSVWSILQILAALFLEALVSNKDVEVISVGFLMSLRGLVCVMGGFFVAMIGMNRFKNVLLSQYTWGEICEKLEEHRYHQLNFVYLIVIGFLIFMFNEIRIFSVIPISLFVLIVHIAYMVLIKAIDPYKQSLNVHKYGLFLCQFTYLLFLIVINFINFVGIKVELISLVIVYLIFGLCVFIIVFTVVRLYYEYRYGAELEKKIQK